MALFKLEMRRLLFSLIFLLTVAGVAAFAWSQGVIPSADPITKPEPGGAYGSKPSGDPALIMPEAAVSLYGQYAANRYITYPNGFYKMVRLNESKKAQMSAVITELAEDGVISAGGAADLDGKEIKITGGDMTVNMDGSVNIIMPEDSVMSVDEFTLKEGLAWERFLELMERADDILGGGSDFSGQWLEHRFGQIPVTYEEALADYELAVTGDRLTGAHARLFSDYMGIIMSLLPVFPAVFFCLADRRRIAPVLQSRRVSSAKLILTRFAALLCGVMLPVLVMSAIMTAVYAAEYGAANIDIWAYFKYGLFWIMPTAITGLSIGMFFSTLTSTPIAIGAQLAWWFFDMMGGSGMYEFQGVTALKLIPRHNALGKTAVYLGYRQDLIWNRVWITLIALGLAAASVIVYSLKRRGLLNVSVFKMFGNDKERPEV
ncbi:MAG: hypothetical protein LBS19_04930 [Clostridiales bacterium]|jgi:hypothetical protein|nr:hypothetical protein [Clostridiales bacterium]